jgi:hypothetical protein
LPKTLSIPIVFEVLRVKTAAKLGWIALLGLASGAYAQRGPAEADHSDIRIVSSFDAAGEPVPTDCAVQAHVFAESLVRYPRPRSWHWVLVCDEAGWRRFLRLSGRDEHEAIYASTDLEACTTYLRGDKLLNSKSFGAEMDTVVAHELAHIRLNSGDEARVDSLARMWQEGLR